MTTPAAVSSAGESPSAGAPQHLLCAGVLVDAESLELLSDITLEEAPESGIALPVLATGAREFITSMKDSLRSPMAIERALQLYLEQRLTTYGLRHSEVIARALIRP
ncbi:hypothetical protein [Microbacterium aurum]